MSIVWKSDFFTYHAGTNKEKRLLSYADVAFYVDGVHAVLLISVTHAADPGIEGLFPEEVRMDNIRKAVGFIKGLPEPSQTFVSDASGYRALVSRNGGLILVPAPRHVVTLSMGQTALLDAENSTPLRGIFP